MVVTDVEAVCRSEAQRVLTHLRGNRKFGSLSRGWRELEDGNPIKQISQWRCAHEASPVELLEPFLRIVRSPVFAGPSTFVALEATHAVVVAICESLPLAVASGEPGAIASTLAEVSNAVCECVFEETHAQTDEAVAMQMVAVLGLCCTVRAETEAAGLFPASTRLRAFVKVLSLWEHYRHSHVLRASAHMTLQRMLDAACAALEAHTEFVTMVFDRILSEVESGIPVERTLLYLRCLQRFTTHPAARRWSVTESPQARFFQELVPMVLLRIGENFGTNITVLSLLLPVVNRTCWLSVNHWVEASVAEHNGHSLSLGALQVEALLTSIYLRILTRAAAPLQSTEGPPPGVVGLTFEEGAELLAVLLEGLSDLLQADTVRTIWLSFDADWRRPPLLERAVQCLADLFRDVPSTERQLPAHVVHLSTTVLARMVAAFDVAPPARGADGAGGRPTEQEEDQELARLREQWRRREAVAQFMAKLEESPKKARAALEKSGLLDFLPLPEPPCEGSSCSQGQQPEEWSRKLTWVFRCLNHMVPYAAMGEFFGQPKDDSKHAFAVFVDTFDMGAADLDEALRGFLQAFLLPGESQQIDRVLQIFGESYFRKHMEHCQSSGLAGTGYLRSADAAYTLAFSVIMLNVDQHNPKLKKRMVLKDFVSNNRGINDGENLPEDAQARIFDNIRKREIKTPSSGSLESVSPARWRDFMHLVRRGYRDNRLAGSHRHARAYAQGFLERMGDRVRTALELALALDGGAHSDALAGLERLLHLALRHRLAPEADAVADGLFFFGTEVFHEAQHRAALGRGLACLRSLFRIAMVSLEGLSTRQLHLLVYLTVQFALYGLVDRALPQNDPTFVRLLRLPTLVVDPPTGVVYSFLRKISTAPFKMLSYAEDGAPAGEAGAGNGQAPAGSPSAGSASDAENAPLVSAAAAQEPSPTQEPDARRGEPAAPAPSPQPSEAGEGAGPEGHGNGLDEGSLQDNPLRPQIERAFDFCGLEAFTRALVGAGREADEVADKLAAAPPPAAAASNQVLLAYLAALFVALRVAGGSKIAKDQDLPWWPEPPAWPNTASPQALQLPRRALSLNILDGYETLRLAVRLTLVAFDGQQVALSGGAGADVAAAASTELPAADAPAIQELAICAHVGLFHTLRRADLSERALRVAIAGTFQVGAALLRAGTLQGHLVSLGWPTRLIEVLVRRADGEPQLLVPAARLCMEAVRNFVIEVSRARRMDLLELWRCLLLLLLKAMPTGSRALWSGTIHREVEAVQGQLWRRGIVWVLGHPHLIDCLGAEDAAVAKGGALASPTATEGSAAFWAWVLPELTSLASEIAGGSSGRATSARLLLDAYGTLLLNICRAQTPEEYAIADELQSGDQSASPPPAADAPIRSASAPAALGDEADGALADGNSPETRRATDGLQMAALSSAWSRVAVALLGHVAPLLMRPSSDEVAFQVVPLLRQTLLSVRVPTLLGGAALGPYWARFVLEKLVSMLTNVANSGAPLVVVRDAVSLVAKFFLQNLHTLQRHEQFGQLWLMVVRLMLLFAKRGGDDRDAELEEIAIEALKNLLRVLLSMKILGFAARKASNASASPDDGGTNQAPVWWQMTWELIEVFRKGFGEDFFRSTLPREEDAPPPAPPAPEPPAAALAAAAPASEPAAQEEEVAGAPVPTDAPLDAPDGGHNVEALAEVVAPDA